MHHVSQNNLPNSRSIQAKMGEKYNKAAIEKRFATPIFRAFAALAISLPADCHR
jgi:hypothetical protein